MLFYSLFVTVHFWGTKQWLCLCHVAQSHFSQQRVPGEQSWPSGWCFWLIKIFHLGAGHHMEEGRKRIGPWWVNLWGALEKCKALQPQKKMTEIGMVQREFIWRWDETRFCWSRDPKISISCSSRETSGPLSSFTTKLLHASVSHVFHSFFYLVISKPQFGKHLQQRPLNAPSFNFTVENQTGFSGSLM